MFQKDDLNEEEIKEVIETNKDLESLFKLTLAEVKK